MSGDRGGVNRFLPAVVVRFCAAVATDGGPVGRGVEWLTDVLARMFYRIEQAITPRWLRRWDLRRRAGQVREHIAWIRSTRPGSMHRAELVAMKLGTLGAIEREIAALCRHRWRPNRAWSASERCDRCGTDRPAEPM